MDKKETAKVKTVSLPGDRGPEIQYRLTAFTQSTKTKSISKTKKIPATQISSKNVTTNIVHNNTHDEKSKVQPNENKEAESTLVLLRDAEEIKLRNIDEFKANVFTEFCCATEKDSTGSWIAGIEFFQDGHLVLLDTNNCKLKRFNTLLRLQSETEVPVDCANMTKISDNEVAVTCLNEIHFYSVGHFGMSRSSKYFEVKGYTYGVSYEESRYAVTCDVEDDEKCAIRILDIFGDEIHVIKPKDSKGEHVAISTYCQIDATHRVVVVSDFDNRRLLCFHFNGTLKWECDVEGGPRGLLKIGNDFIVADNYGQEICAISIETGKKRTVLQDEDGVFNPEFIACNHKDPRFAVTQRAFDTISIFKLTKKN